MAAILSCTIVNNTSFLRHQHPLSAFSKTTSLLGLKSNYGSHSRGGATMMASYKVTLITPDGTKEFLCADDENIIEGASISAGVDLPYSRMAGACSSCIGKIKTGKVDQLLGSFLEDEDLNAGWVLTCVAYPTCDVVIETHKEEEYAA